MSELPVDKAAQDLAGAVDFLLGHEAVTSSKVGAVGFCMGGGFVIVLAAQQGDRIGAAVPFYGVLKEDYPDLSGLTAPGAGPLRRGGRLHHRTRRGRWRTGSRRSRA